MDASYKADKQKVDDKPIRFALVGGGWRAEFYLRIAQALPAHFQVTAVQVRDANKREAFGARWPVRAVGDLDELLATEPDYVVASVPWPAMPVLLRELATRGVAALAETPPAPDLAGLISLYNDTRGARIQVAEQFHLQPHHAARLSVAASGKLGRISQAQISVAHGYHGLSLIRKFLKIGAENATITARQWESPLVAGPNREGAPQSEKVIRATQTLAHFDFGDRQGIYDFSGEQYFSWIRAPRLLVRGERGEISNDEVRYLHDFQTPISTQLVRRDLGQQGNLEGFSHQGILMGEKWIYRVPFPSARLSDEEIAIATCLLKMSQYVGGAPAFYSLAQASQDHYLGLMLELAVKTNGPVETSNQAWSEDLMD